MPAANTWQKNFYDLIGPEFSGRDHELGVEVAGKVAHFVRSGATWSSGAVNSIVSLAAAELTIRANLAWVQLQRTAEAWGLPIDVDFADAAKTLLSDVIRACEGEIRAVVMRSAVLTRDTGLTNILWQGQVTAAARRATRKLGAEVDLIVAAAGRNSMGGNSSSNVFNVAGNVASIQMGAGSVAVVSQSIDPAALDQIRQFLDRVEHEISSMQAASLPLPKSDVLEIIAASKAEAAKERPNLTLLKSLLGGIGNAIGTIASLQGTYEAGRGVLALLGIG